MLLVLINVLIICVVGAICFWAIERFVRDGRLANLLKVLVVLICVAAILQPTSGIGCRLLAGAPFPNKKSPVESSEAKNGD